nr:Arginine biosynthesis bifunctional protein ArgJ, chloroplastic [Ipomoea batatas]
MTRWITFGNGDRAAVQTFACKRSNLTEHHQEPEKLFGSPERRFARLKVLEPGLIGFPSYSSFEECRVAGAENEVEAAKIQLHLLHLPRHATSSGISPTDSHSLLNAAVYGRDPNWGCIACAAGYAELFLSTQINGNPSLHFNGSWSGQNSFHNPMSTPVQDLGWESFNGNWPECLQ